MIFDGIIVGIPKQSYRVNQDGSVSGQISFHATLETGEEHKLFVAGQIGKFLPRIGQGSLIQYQIHDFMDVAKAGRGKQVRVFKPFVRNASFYDENEEVN